MGIGRRWHCVIWDTGFFHVNEAIDDGEELLAFKVIMELIGEQFSKRRHSRSLKSYLRKEELLFVDVIARSMEIPRMDNPNLTMEEYIRLEEEKARKRGKVFNGKTATYGKIKIDDDLYDLSSMEAEFPAIVINDDFAPQDTL
ncbi:hypothetical protein Tco_0174911 [Tanacetum coccineum]